MSFWSRRKAFFSFGAILAALLSGPRDVFGTEKPSAVRVILWFDTEDYLLPADDDASLRLARLLSERNVRATFKIVGEKARVLEKRGRKDVIEALRKHDIGFHSNFHSVHPTPSEYLAECGWADGVAEFVRREGPGADDVRRIFGVPTLSCYGQPGSSWGPQTLAGLGRIGVAPHGVPCYVDSGSHVGIGGVPFWYCGALTLYKMNPNETRMDLHEPGGLEKGCEDFRKIHERLAADGGGLISIFYHPCEWVHREFWDGVNFSRGANPPREEWKAPRQRTVEETEAAFQRFEKYVDFQRSLPGVEFVTASDLPGLYPDLLRAGGASRSTLKSIVRALETTAGVGFIKTEDGLLLSAADQFVALCELLRIAHATEKVPAQVSVPLALGPADGPPVTEVDSLDGRAFRDAVLDARDEAFRRGQIPSRVFAGVKRIAPADFLKAMGQAAKAALASAEKGEPVKLPESVAIPKNTRIWTEKHVAEDTPGLFGGWVIHTEGFRAPRILEHARLQAWTLKPAK